MHDSTNFEGFKELFKFNSAYIIDAQIETDLNNSLYVSAGNGTHIFLITSSDQGTSWSTPKLISEFGVLSNLFHDIAIDTKNNLILVYDFNLDAFIKNSSDHGQTWSPPRNVGAYIRISVLFNSYDNLIFVGSSDMNSLVCMQSSDLGYNWTAPITIENNIELGDSPILQLDKENKTNLFYIDEGHNTRFTYISSENGSVWSVPSIIYQILGHVGAFGADIDSGNRKIVVWYETHFTFHLRYESILYTNGIPANYFTGVYMEPFLIGLLWACGIYLFICTILWAASSMRQIREKKSKENTIKQNLH